MNETELRKELEFFEGKRNDVYLDNARPPNPTVGVGHMDRNMIVGTVMGPSQIDAFYQVDVKRALDIAKKNCNFDALDEVRQRVMIQLCFNLGNRISGFKKFLSAMDKKDFVTAADELQDSAWFGQVGRRGPITCMAVRTGHYEF